MTSYPSLTMLCLSSVHFALYNVTKIRPYRTQYATQLLVQAMVIFRTDYCNILLAGLPSCTVKPSQMVQIAVKCLVFDQPKRAHVTPLYIDLHCLPMAAQIKLKLLMPAYRVTSGSAPMTVLVCGSTMVEQVTKCYQSRSVPL